MNTPSAEQSLARFLDIMKKLRDPNGGCPWDREQTFQSLRPQIIEEAYEVADAIDLNSVAITEELGDLLSVVALFAAIGEEQGLFSFGSILDGISDKLVRRHPHVFGDTKVAGTEEVLKNWEVIKQKERGGKGEEQKGLLDGLPRSLPALLKAHEIGERCARVGFDWSSKEEVAEKVHEELGEFFSELSPSSDGKKPNEDSSQVAVDRERVFEEFGDLLFTLAQYSRHLGFNAEEALVAANTKFMKRFKTLEKLAYETHGDTPLSQLGRDALESLWSRVKLG